MRERNRKKVLSSLLILFVGQVTVDITHSVAVALWISLGTGLTSCFVSLFLPPPLSPSVSHKSEETTIGASPSEQYIQVQDDPSTVRIPST